DRPHGRREARAERRADGEGRGAGAGARAVDRREADVRRALRPVRRQRRSYAFHVICCTSVYSSIPHFPPSRPMPLSLNPPNGASVIGRRPLLIHTTPVRIRFATPTAFPTSDDEIPPPNP